VILAARPSMGKTALALNIAHHVAAKLGETVAIFSLEMSKESLLTRVLCASAYVDSQKFRAGYLNQDERRKLQKAALDMVEAPMFIDDTSGVNLMDMHAKLRRLQQQGHKLGLVIVDYLQLMSGRGRFENRNAEVSAISRGMKLLAKEMDVPMLVLSQLSRAPETRQGDHRPQLSDLRESGSIEQDADLVGFIFRPEVYKRDDDSLKGLAELIVAKQRNGPVGKVDLVFLHSMTKFENRAEELGGVSE
jgi:replicative DNA helicase